MIWGQVAAIFLLLGLLAGTLILLRRKGLAQFPTPRSTAKLRSMQVLERMPLTAQHSLHLIAVEGRTLLLGVSPSGISPIALTAAVTEEPTL